MELRYYWQILFKRWRTLLWIVGITVAATLLYSLIATPVFKFTSKIWIKTSDPKVKLLSVLPTDLSSLGAISSDLVMQGQLRIIQNYPLIKEMISELELKRKNGQPYAVQDILNPGSLALVIRKKGIAFRVPQSTSLIEVEAYSDQPSQAVAMANQVAEKFVDFYHDITRKEAEEVYQYILDQIPRMDAELRDAEKALYQFRIANQTGSISTYREKLISSLTTLEEGRDTAIRETFEAEKKVKEILTKLRSIPEFRQSAIGYESNPRIDYVRKKIVDQEADLASNTQKLTPEHLTVKQSEATVDRYKDILKKEIKETFSSRTKSRNSLYDTLAESLVNSEVNAALYKARQQSYDKLIPAKIAQLGELTQKEMDQVRLERRVTAIKDNFTKLLSDEQTAKLTKESYLSNALIVEKASLPEITEIIKRFRWFPQRRLLVILATVLSLLLGLTVISLQEYFDNSVSDPQETESLLKIPVLATLPQLDRLEPVNVIHILQQKLWQRGIWQIRAWMRKQKISSGILATTSACPREGKTLLTACLGQILAQDKYRVLLVDLNFVNPGLGKLWQLPPGPGICEVLQGRSLLTECLHAVGQGELHLLPNGRTIDLPLGYWDPDSLATILASLKPNYEFILLDLPEVGEGEGALFSSLADHTLMVIAAGQTPQDVVARALELVKRGYGQVWGLVLNNIPPSADPLTAWQSKLWQQIGQWVARLERFFGRSPN
jgi:polysaccharide biosynthesis transport protein